MPFGPQLRALRRRLGLSQAQFAALIGVASNTVARWERSELGMRGTTSKVRHEGVHADEEESERVSTLYA